MLKVSFSHKRRG